MSQFLLKDAGLTEVLTIINEMIEESVYHTETFAHALQVHRNRKAANIFLYVADQFKKELQIVSKYGVGVQLLHTPPWQSPHDEYMHPSSLLTDAHHLMSEEEAWKMVDKMVKIHQNFYKHLNEESENESVISLIEQLIDYCNKREKLYFKGIA